MSFLLNFRAKIRTQKWNLDLEFKQKNTKELRKFFTRSRELGATSNDIYLQENKLIERVEQFAFFTTGNIPLQNLKTELFNQISCHRLKVSANEFFNVDRRLVTNVRSPLSALKPFFVKITINFSHNL